MRLATNWPQTPINATALLVDEPYPCNCTIYLKLALDSEYAGLMSRGPFFTFETLIDCLASLNTNFSKK